MSPRTQDISSHIIACCREKLLQAKAELLNQVHDQRLRLTERTTSGDEGDLSLQANDEIQMFISHRRTRQQLLEIESALARLSAGTFGICEITGEPIETDRLLALPWTRLSIEGAELQEAESRRQSRTP